MGEPVHSQGQMSAIPELVSCWHLSIRESCIVRAQVLPPNSHKSNIREMCTLPLVTVNDKSDAISNSQLASSPELFIGP